MSRPKCEASPAATCKWCHESQHQCVLDGTDPKLVAYAQNVSLAKVYKNITRLQLRKMYVSPTERQKLIAKWRRASAYK